MHHPPEHERDSPGPTGPLSATPAKSATNSRRLLVIGVCIVLAVAGLAWALSLGLARGPDQVVVERSPLIGQPAPDFALGTLDGRTVSLADYRGRPVIVNFWASWCVPCRDEFPLLRDARERHAAAGLEVLGIIHDDGPEAARAFAASYGADWPLLQDPDDAAWTDYGGVFLPITFYVDRGGIVRAVSYGPPPTGVLEEQIAKIL